MIDPKLCFSATNEIIKISKTIADSYKPKEEYETEVELVLSIYEELNSIVNSCSSDVREGYTRHIAERYPEWIRDEAYKLIRLREIKGTLSKMRSSLKPSVDNYIRE
tara:strand:+ start:161 stop:481 length:321 start_codon:yes stop_codon:yes gene_type:complete